ncbi:ABC transporter ATP-binding protein [Parafrankia sp. BMG5.11]|uniref:ABC transporter ATP-binding protein n=1 Tax=Parafrankia sp. BMG5.11 TaxID=222540 RepID=UPI001039BBD0|nr:ABC transporter ATP-binding protein [Parafrankia sp. BMG5.11]TCJ34601.1 ABC transporter ATP-binding protein [Parafrankia sp. BMG5.11]
MTGLRLNAVEIHLDSTPIVRNLTVDCPPGTFVGLLGPNGSGKSTVLRAVYHALRPRAGAVLLDGVDVHRDLGPRATARQIAALTQEHAGEVHLRVRDVVATGRLPHQSSFSPVSHDDRAVVTDALRTVGMTALAQRPFADLSGGEKQRVLLARALAQQPRVLVLDEPTNHLDIGARLDLLELIRSLGITVLAALHDLDLAAAYCDLVHVLADGQLLAAGPPADVLTPDLLRQVFKVAAHRTVHPLTGRPHFAFASLAAPPAARPGEPSDCPSPTPVGAPPPSPLLLEGTP